MKVSSKPYERLGRAILNSTLLVLGGCSGKSVPDTSAGNKTPASISPQRMADSLYAVLSADRAVYAEKVVTRLQDQEKVIKADEHFEDQKALPLPAQMFRMGAERVRKAGHGFSYSLLSEWAINKQNAPRTDIEKAGLRAVTEKDNKFYSEETLDGKRYFTAIYADKAVAPACATCHNGHVDSPKKDFKLGDTIGGVVIRIPLDQ